MYIPTGATWLSCKYQALTWPVGGKQILTPRTSDLATPGAATKKKRHAPPPAMVSPDLVGTKRMGILDASLGGLVRVFVFAIVVL